MEVSLEQFQQACVGNDLDTVKRIVNAGADLYLTDGRGRSPFDNACYVGNLEIVRYLVEQGIDINKTHGLACAVKGEHEPVVAYLCEKGADVSAKSTWYGTTGNGYSPFACACGTGQLGIAEHLRKAGVDVNNSEKYDRTALLHTLYWYLPDDEDEVSGGPTKEHTLKNGVSLREAVSYLVKAGVDVNLGHPIRQAIEQNYFSIVKYLAEHGAKFEAYDVNRAIETGSLELVRYVYERVEHKKEKSNRRYTSAVAKKGSLEIATYLSDKEPITTEDIAIAAEHNHQAILTYWLETRKIPIEPSFALWGLIFRAKAPDTALYVIQQWQDPSIASLKILFLNACADNTNLELVEWLIHKINLDEFTETNTVLKDQKWHGPYAEKELTTMTPLSVASYEGASAVFRFLVSHGAKPIPSLLLKACACHEDEKAKATVETLLEYDGMSLTHQDMDGNTALHIACQPSFGRTKPSTIEYLCTKGANLTTKNKMGKTPIQIVIDQMKEESYSRDEFKKILQLMVVYGTLVPQHMTLEEKTALVASVKLPIDDPLIICPCCDSVFKDPVTMSCCGETLCLECVAALMRPPYGCPSDRTFLGRCGCGEFIRTTLSDLKVTKVLVKTLDRFLDEVMESIKELLAAQEEGVEQRLEVAVGILGEAEEEGAEEEEEAEAESEEEEVVVVAPRPVSVSVPIPTDAGVIMEPVPIPRRNGSN